MKRKMLCLVLAMLLILSLLPTMALADGPSGTWQESVTAQPTGFTIDTSAKTISISSADGLAWFGKQLNGNANYSGYTITISGTLDMGAHYWIPINAYGCGNLANATIQGDNGAEIKNLQINQSVTSGNYNYYSGFIGQIDGGLTIKNLTFSGAVGVDNSSGIAVVCGQTYSNLTIQNVTVKNSEITGTTKAGAFVGFTGGDGITVTLDGCRLENTTVKGNYSFALMIGLVNINDHATVTNTVAVNSKTEWVADEDDPEKGDIIYNGCYYTDDNGTLWMTDPVGAWVEGRTNPSPKVTIGGIEYTLKGDWVIRPVAQITKDNVTTKYGSLAAAVKAAQANDTIELLQYRNGDENYNFTKSDDGFCYVDASKKTGRLVWLDIASAGDFTTETTFYVNGDQTARTIQNILLDSASRLELGGSAYLKSGDILILPQGTLYVTTGGTIDDVYGDITFVGAGKDKTVVCPLISGTNYRFFRLYNRYTKNIADNVIYHYNFKNLTFDAQYASTTGDLNLFVVTCYNIDISMDTVDVKNFDGAVFSVWANDTLNDAQYEGDHTGFTHGTSGYYPTKTMNCGVNINLKNVSTDSNGKLIHFDCSPYQTRDLDNSLDCYAYIHLNYDDTCAFNDKTDVSGNYVFTDPNHDGYDTTTYSVNASTAYCQNNCWINDVDVLPPAAQVTSGDVTTKYATLAEAVNAANKINSSSFDDAPVLELLADCNIIGPAHSSDNYGAVHFYDHWGDGAYFIIKGNNHTIKLAGTTSSNSKKYWVLKFAAGCKAKVSDLTVDSNPSVDSTYLKGAIDCTNSEAEFNNVTVKNTNGGWSAFGITSAKVTLTNCTATDKVKQVISVAVGSGDLKTVSSSATIISGVYDGTIRTEADYGTDAKLEIKGGQFSFVDKNDQKTIDEAEGTDIAISGGIFAESPAANLLAEGYKAVDNDDEATKAAYPKKIVGKQVAKIGEKIYKTLAAAVDEAENGDTVNLLDDETLSADVTINKNITLDLAGRTVECGTYFLKITGDVTITGNGTINKEGLENTTTLTYPGITGYSATFKGAVYVAENAKLTIKNGTYTTKTSSLFVCNNGTLTMEDGLFKCTSTNPYDTKGLIDVRGEHGVLNVLGGSVECYENYGDYAGMYGVSAWDGGTMNLGSENTNGPTVHSYYAAIATNGNSAPVTINVYSGTYISDLDSDYVSSSDSAYQDMNVIQIAADNKDGTVLNIYGGTFTQTAKTNKTGHVIEVRYGAKKTINIYGGQFSSNNSVIHRDAAKDEANTTITISGGYFTSDPTAYLVSGKVAVASDEEGYNFMVEDKNSDVDVVTVTSVGQTPAPSTEGMQEGAAKDVAASIAAILDTNPDVVQGVENLIPDAKSITNNDKVIPKEEEVSDILSEAGIEVGGNTVTVVVEPYFEIAITSAEAIETSICSVTFSVDAKYNLIATTAEDPSQIEKENPTSKNAITLATGQALTVTKPVTLTLPLPENFNAVSGTAVYVKHVHDGKTYVYNGTVLVTDTDPVVKTVTFTNPNGFSEFTVVKEADTAASIERGGNTMYFVKFADAVAEVRNAETIKLETNAAIDAVVSREVSFTLKKNGKTASGSITAGTNYKNTGSGDNYIFVYDAPTPSNIGGGSGTKNYDITIEAAANGSASTDKTSAAKGETVVITLTPDKGYVLHAFIVLDKNGAEIKTTDLGNGKYSFEMPAGKVNIKSSFIEDETLQNFFVDVPENAYFYDAVRWALKGKITNGMDETHFGPTGITTRAQVVTFLWRAAGQPEPTEIKSFADVSSDAYYAKAVAWAVENNITKGVKDGKFFAPEQTCSRGEIVTFLHRYSGQSSYTLESNPFADVESGKYYYDAVLWAYANNITNGMSDTIFDPLGSSLRGQTITFLYRYMVK